MAYDPNEPRDKSGQWTGGEDVPADLRAEIEKQKTGSGPLSPQERVELNELKIVQESRGRLSMLSQARMDHLKSRS